MQNTETAKTWRVASSPHIRSEQTTMRIMLDVLIALIPAGVMGVYYFGTGALYTILACVLSAVLWEALIQKITKKPVTISDLSAAVTGLLLAYNLPSTVPLYIPIVGSGVAIILVKQIFGGIGHNFVNPALAARAVLLASWVGSMSGAAFIIPGNVADAVSSATADALTVATPLSNGASGYTYWQLLIGQIPGCIGETCKLALLAGGLYLIARRVISFKIPFAMILTVFVLFLVSSGSLYEGNDSALYQILSGGLFLGAFFMATDYTTSPVTPLGQWIMGIGCGLLVFVIRKYNPSYPEGCSYAILIMNLFVPLIDRFTKPRVFGEVKQRAKHA